jgi:hypothetical protein
MIRVTTAKRIQISPPDQTWSLVIGANHFESEMPAAVSTQLAKLQADGSITVETIDGNGHITPWQAS